MTDANKGYVGRSMSVRVAEAYDNDEMPRSKWTKQAMLARMAGYCEDCGLDCKADVLEGMARDELFHRFFYRSSWHHTGKLFNQTDFYSLDEETFEEWCESPTVRKYHITYALGRSEVRAAAEFDTNAKAERFLRERGFVWANYAFVRGNFYASVGFDEIDV